MIGVIAEVPITPDGGGKGSTQKVGRAIAERLCSTPLIHRGLEHACSHSGFALYSVTQGAVDLTHHRLSTLMSPNILQQHPERTFRLGHGRDVRGQ